MTADRPGATSRRRIARYRLNQAPVTALDTLTTEEPLEIRVVTPGSDSSVPVALTMRTPGHDFELAAGFLFTEGIIPPARSRGAPSALARIEYCVGPFGEQQYNAVTVYLQGDRAVDLDRLQRNFYTTSSCGVCGKASLDSLRTQVPDWSSLRAARPSETPVSVRVSSSTIAVLPARLREAQSQFERTGGLHGCGLFTPEGDLLLAREDVGRHNALDKLIGAHVLSGDLPLDRHILVVSGRASFELVQKAAMCAIPLMVAVGAPSSLAVDTAAEFGMTLIGFARVETFNAYAHPERIRD